MTEWDGCCCSNTLITLQCLIWFFGSQPLMRDLVCVYPMNSISNVLSYDLCMSYCFATGRISRTIRSWRQGLQPYHAKRGHSLMALWTIRWYVLTAASIVNHYSSADLPPVSTIDLIKFQRVWCAISVLPSEINCIVQLYPFLYSSLYKVHRTLSFGPVLFLCSFGRWKCLLYL